MNIEMDEKTLIDFTEYMDVEKDSMSSVIYLNESESEYSTTFIPETGEIDHSTFLSHCQGLKDDLMSETMFSSGIEPGYSSTMIPTDTIETSVNDGYASIYSDDTLSVDPISSTTWPIENESEYSSIIILQTQSFQVQNEIDGVNENEFHRVINVNESNDTFTISSHPITNELEKPMAIINFSKSTVGIEPNQIEHLDGTSDEYEGINSVTIHPSSNESAQQNLIFIVNGSEVNAENDEIDCNMSPSFDKVNHGKITSTGTDPNENKFVKPPNYFGQEPPIYICEICNTVFLSSSTLARHTKTHFKKSKKNDISKKSPQKSDNNMSLAESKFYARENCNEASLSLSTLTRHTKIHCNDFKKNNISKKLSSQKFGNMSSTEDSTYKCDVCKEAFLDSSTLARHAETHLNGSKENNIFSESPPQKSDPIRDNFEKSTLTGHTETNCNDSKNYNISKKLSPQNKFDNMSSIGDSIYKCGNCTRAFFDSSTLARHTETHSKDNSKKNNIYKKLPAPKIDNKSPIRDILNKYNISYRDFFESSNSAGPTDKRSDSKENNIYKKLSPQKIHNMSPIEYRNYNCDICNKYFFDSLTFIRHTHYDDDSNNNQFYKRSLPKKAGKYRPLTCGICNKDYCNILDLTRHAMKHYDDDSINHQPYKKSFPRISGMSHIGNRPFTCRTCNKGYFDSLDLGRHARKHRCDYSKNHCVNPNK